MSVLFIILPLAIVLGGAAVWAFVAAARSGQYDDLDSPAWRMLFTPDECVRHPGGGEAELSKPINPPPVR